MPTVVIVNRTEDGETDQEVFGKPNWTEDDALAWIDGIRAAADFSNCKFVISTVEEPFTIPATV